MSWADQVEPYSSLKPHAPLEVHKNDKPDPALSPAEARELVGEFRGILAYGIQDYTYEKWPGKEISDCRSVTSESMCGECELTTGHARTTFTFYRTPALANCLLQQVDVHFQVSDPAVIKSLKPVGRDLLGSSIREVKPSSRESGWDGSGPGWKWEGNTDIAYLYMDTDQSSINGQGVARFQWRRSPLFKPSK